MRILILLVSVFYFQNQKILVLNESTTEPIQSASVFVYKNGKAFKSGSTNEKGEFYFNDVYDSIVVHSVGFEDKKHISHNTQNCIIYLKEKNTLLKELTINAKKKEIFIGEHKKSSSETRFIGHEEQFALLFRNPSNKNYLIKALFLNLKKVPYKTELVFNFYEADTVQREYRNQKNNKKTILTEVIPDAKKHIDTFRYVLMPNSNKEIVEINLDSLNIKIPENGIFISVYSENIYDDKNDKKSISSISQVPILYQHKTNENNYCKRIPVNEIYWQNSNLILRHHEDTDDFHPLFPMVYYEPSMAVKAEENVQ